MMGGTKRGKKGGKGTERMKRKRGIRNLCRRISNEE